MDWASLGSFVVSLATLGGLIVALRRSRFEGRRADSDTDEALERRIEEARDRAERERKRRIEAEVERDRLASELRELRERVRHLEEALEAFPLAVVAPRLLQPLQELLAGVLDFCTDLVAVTAAEGNGGRFLWLNARWEEVLGWRREEVIAMGWRELIHPADLAATTRVETKAWTDEVEIVNRYRRRDGSYVTLRWRAAKYQGVSFAVAKVHD